MAHRIEPVTATQRPWHGIEFITRKFDTLTQAERFQNRLYDKYDSVRLTVFPRFTENGNYTWQVSN